MIKLYLKEDNCLTQYHEAWISEEQVVEHWGELGERGQIRTHDLDASMSEQDNLERLLSDPIRQGYQPIDMDDHAICLIEYSVDGIGNAENLEKRHALEDRMNETLGWTGLGLCDGGSIGSGTMEVCCFVVDFDCAKRVIESDLNETRFADYIRIYDEGAE